MPDEHISIPSRRAKLDEMCYFYQQAYERYNKTALKEIEEQMRQTIEEIQRAWLEGEADG